MNVQSVDLSLLEEVSCGLGQVDVIKLNDIEIWRRNISTIRFVQSDLYSLPDDGNTSSIVDIAFFNDNVVIVKGNLLYFSSDMQNWTTVVLSIKPISTRITNNKLFYFSDTELGYTNDLIYYVSISKFSTTTGSIYDVCYSTKDSRYYVWTSKKQFYSTNLSSWTNYLKTTGTYTRTFHNVKGDNNYYRIYLNDKNYNIVSKLTAVGGSCIIKDYPIKKKYGFCEDQKGHFVPIWKTSTTRFHYNTTGYSKENNWKYMDLPSPYRFVLGINGEYFVVHETGACKIKSDYSGYEKISVENFTPIKITDNIFYCEDKDNKTMYATNEEHTGIYKFELKG